ncbi:uncharacterized protein NFIA_112170 [Aspergillus fischeri NRRL 181]|uniref:Chromo domain-containing protein n=1 Tax=Neosartorya fischeri (strain ATCC 1020 / DSM 3700 / CBS 544.65 / FGSC A1164 / JCM 1740 / NRRL 181 / WB 181) TaxID=331117 RepID=A1D8I2_NEOFI|nr:uncharacterized protein NFIA_112170 [Aspergillus fischeri NRRL 181]EAW20693.1 hypothetical protein NFIA_112170 [Aspergillus fischeri NRRL 181]
MPFQIIHRRKKRAPTQEIWEETQQRATQAQERQRQQANRHRHREDFNVGDKVFVNTRNCRVDQPGRKLADQAAGAFEIVGKYRVKWVGQGDEVDTTWYPKRNFKNAQEKLLEFYRRYPDEPGPPKRLNLLAEAALNDRFKEDHPDNDRPA